MDAVLFFGQKYMGEIGSGIQFCAVVEAELL